MRSIHTTMPSRKFSTDTDLLIIINGFQDRRQHIDQQLTVNGKINPEKLQYITEASTEGFFPCQNWRDPYSKRLTTIGEINCAAKHEAAWKLVVKSNCSGALIIEDDAKILRPLEGTPVKEPFTYFGGKPLQLQQAGPMPADGFQLAGYTYWAVGYWISQDMASYLLEQFNRESVLAVDEFIPWVLGTNPNVEQIKHEQSPLPDEPNEPMHGYLLPEFVIEPSGHWASGTEQSESAFNLLVLLPATDLARSSQTKGWWEDLGYNTKVLGAGEPAWDASGPGGAEKLIWLKEKLASWSTEQRRTMVVLLVDGYDTRPLVEPENLLQRFAELSSPMVISGERVCWPDVTKANLFGLEQRPELYIKDAIHPYPYPCSGFVMGFSHHWQALLSGDLTREEDDQGFLHSKILHESVAGEWKIDAESYLCHNLHHAESEIQLKNDWVFNTKTNCYPAVLHANGPAPLAGLDPWAAAQVQDQGQDQGPGQDGLLSGWNLSSDWPYIEVADGILAVEVMPESVAEELAKTALMVQGGWKPLPGDNVPGDELRYKDWRLKESEAFTQLLDNRLKSILEHRWAPSTWHPVKDLFLIRYSIDRQPSLRLHEDKSHFSCSLILKRACNGGEMLFPRQNFSDRLIRPGMMICWPSRVTHPHQVLPVKKGYRLSCVVWTQQ